MGTLGTSLKKVQENLYFSDVIERCLYMVRTVSISKKASTHVANLLLAHWIVLFRISTNVFTDGGLLYWVKSFYPFIKIWSQLLGNWCLSPKKRGQVKWFYSSIVTLIWYCFKENQRNVQTIFPFINKENMTRKEQRHSLTVNPPYIWVRTTQRILTQEDLHVIPVFLGLCSWKMRANLLNFKSEDLLPQFIQWPQKSVISGYISA